MYLMSFSSPPSAVDRVIVHQFDPARPSPGGIDTCIRGILRYSPSDVSIAVVGVDTGSGPAGREIGKWEQHRFGDRTFWFLPAVKLDPANQSRKIPHSIRLVWGFLKNYKSIPNCTNIQCHRMDVAAALKFIKRTDQVYCIHTQENGLVGSTSDSFWRFFGGIHQAIEKFVVSRADKVFVFNEEYSKVVGSWNKATKFLPTWFDPRLVKFRIDQRNDHDVIWVGRLEIPKDPELAIDAFCQLVKISPANDWKLHMLGSGTLIDSVKEKVSLMDNNLQERIFIHGRVAPENVAEMMGNSGVFLMTSHPGYEGYPRVLVEAMASGLPSVVTDGSDTGGLINNGYNGYVCGRDPNEIASKINSSVNIDREIVRLTVSGHGAPGIVSEMF